MLHRQLAFESLEIRRMLAADILVEDGLLGLRGTNSDDVIQVERIGNQYKLTLNGQSAFVDGANSLQGVIVDGMAGNDHITIDSSVNVFTGVLGGKGNDVIQGGGGDNYLMGDAGNDTIYSGSASSNNHISGGAGNDTIHCGVAGTEAHGDKGNDSLYADYAYATLYGDAGNDYLDAGGRSSKLYGGAGNDTLTGENNSVTDWIYGGAGNDILRGNNDGLYGEVGNDIIYSGDNGNRCVGGKGNDIVYGGAGNDEIFGDEGRDQLFGALGNDTVHGGLGNDLIEGGAGDDWLYGDAGNDSLTGDDDADVIDGGLGNDICRGGAGDDWLTGGLGKNLLDGEGGDNLLSPTGPGETLLNGLPTPTNGNLWTGLGMGHAAYDMFNDNGVLNYKLTLSIQTDPYDTVTHDILIDGIKIGELEPQYAVRRELVFATNPTGTELSFPTGFPGIHAGSVIQIVGIATDTFRAQPFGVTD